MSEIRTAVADVRMASKIDALLADLRTCDYGEWKRAHGRVEEAFRIESHTQRRKALRDIAADMKYLMDGK